MRCTVRRGEKQMVAFEFDGEVYTVEQMLDANAHDEAVCEFVRTAKPGDEFCGCVCVVAEAA